jgi:DNA uptake protein ComE-like DNA-binding protein
MAMAAMTELYEGWNDQSPPARGMGSLARIDLASVDPDEWRWASGVGPVLAERIVACSVERPFQSPEDLRRVYGIGPVAATRLRQQIRLAGP